ncbi:MAG: tetratricopeptide repeat protein [Luteolibacter sp.]
MAANWKRFLGWAMLWSLGWASAFADETASGLLREGENCYRIGEWERAAGYFSRFMTDYAALEEAKKMVASVTPLLAICYVRQGKFEDAIPWFEKALGDPLLDPKLKPQLLFFSGLARVKCQQPAKAREDLGRAYALPGLEASWKMEALILGGTTYVMESDWKGADGFFAKHLEAIRSYRSEAAARVELLWIHALMREKRWDEAASKAMNLSRQPRGIRQIVTFSSLLIELGHAFEVEEPHRAIQLWKCVPTRMTMEKQLQSLAAEVETGGSVPGMAESALAEIRREQEALAELPRLDHAVRLRLAQAYFQLGRTREACLLLDQMLRQMEPDASMESATASLMRGWMSIGRYVRAEKTADLYLKRCALLKDRPNEVDVMFLRAEAIAEQFRHEEAAAAFHEVAHRFKGKPIAARAEFMEAYQFLQLEQYARAGSLFERQLKSLEAGHELRPHVLFWRAMADYFDQKWDSAREKLRVCLKEETDGEYADDCHFRLAYSDFSEARYPEAIRGLKAFIADFPSSEWLAEAQLALGDAYAAEGELDAAEKSYAEISPDASGFHDEAWMKRGNFRKLNRDFSGMREIYQKFVSERGESSRLAEALHWLGWISKQEGKPDEAKELYWRAVEEYGDEPARPGLEEIFLALKNLYPGAETEAWKQRMAAMKEEAERNSKTRLAVRIAWAMAQGGALEKEELKALAPKIVPKETAPRILADVGDALADEYPEQAESIYQGLRKWWPRAPERDRAYAGLGFILLNRGETDLALQRFDQFEKHAVMPRTAPDEKGVSLIEGELGGRVALERARILARRQPERALDVLRALQKVRAMPAKIRAEALLEAGRVYVAMGEARQALPYFEQVYLLFNRYPERVAAAYLERGAALESLGERSKAREVYSELASREDLKHHDEARTARRRAEALGGLLIPELPVSATVPPRQTP